MKRFGEEARRLAGAASLLLGWPPDRFWAATPAELMDSLSPPGEVGEPPTRGTIEALLKRFPDGQGN